MHSWMDVDGDTLLRSWSLAPTFGIDPPLFIRLWELAAQEAVQLGANLQGQGWRLSLVPFHV